MIKKVYYTGDMLEVEREIEGKVTTIRRHVGDYTNLTETEKQALWHEIAEEPLVEYLENIPVIGKWNGLKTAIKNLFKG